MYEEFRIGDYVEGYQVDTDIFTRGYLKGYSLYDKKDPNSVVAEVAKTNSKSVYIKMKTLKHVSRYETLLKVLEEYGLEYVDGKLEGRHKPKFSTGDIARHKNYRDNSGDIVITYVSENGYSYMFRDGTGGGTFGFSAENDYNLIEEEKEG